MAEIDMRNAKSQKERKTAYFRNIDLDGPIISFRFQRSFSLLQTNFPHFAIMVDVAHAKSSTAVSRKKYLIGTFNPYGGFMCKSVTVIGCDDVQWRRRSEKRHERLVEDLKKRWIASGRIEELGRRRVAEIGAVRTEHCERMWVDELHIWSERLLVGNGKGRYRYLGCITGYSSTRRTS